MAGTSSKQPVESKKKARIEIIPLIDVIFFLLATFVLFTLSLEKIKSVPVQFPKATAASQPNPNDTTVTLQVSDQSTCYWTYQNNTELINLSEVTPRLQNYKAQNADPRVLLTTDDRAKFGIAIKVLDEVRKAGIEKVSIETRVRPTGGGS